jgi:hypothetical protein
LYACDLEVPLKGTPVDLLKRRAVLLSWLLSNSCMIEETSPWLGDADAAATSDDSRFPMKGILDVQKSYE